MNTPKKKGILFHSTSYLDDRSQSLFFSATLDVHSNNQQTYRLKQLMSKLARRGNPELIATGDNQDGNEMNESKKENNLLPSGLELRQVMLTGDKEKEEFLYTYGKQYLGHTLVFFNSIRINHCYYLNYRCN